MHLSDSWAPTADGRAPVSPMADVAAFTAGVLAPFDDAATLRAKAAMYSEAPPEASYSHEGRSYAGPVRARAGFAVKPVHFGIAGLLALAAVAALPKRKGRYHAQSAM